MVTASDAAFTVDTTNVGEPAAYRDSFVQTHGYDAIDHRGRRKSPTARITREDTRLKTNSRTKLQSNSNDLARNFAIAGWMIRRHLDYVSLFDFDSQNALQGRAGGSADEELQQLDRDIERLMEEDSNPNNCDLGGRFNREKMFRLAELRRTTDGDVGLLKLASGKMQGIESDLIRDPTPTDLQKVDGDPLEWVNGVRVGAGGRALHYAIHGRGKDGSNYEFQRFVPARNMIHFGHFTRFAADQTRGVSPITAALNPLRDVYEGFDYALAKMKVSQLFALAFYREAEESADPDLSDEDEDAVDYPVDFSGGPIKLDLDPGDRAEFLESKTPSTEMQQFSQLVIAVALKALDIPYSFYDEGHTNFFGSRAGWLLYNRACLDKRADQIEMRRDYTRWKLRSWIQSGRLVLPAGMTIDNLVYEWVPRGMPWWDPSKEVKGDQAAVSSGFDNPERITKRIGNGNVYDNIRATSRVMQFAKEHGVTLDYSACGVNVVPDAEPEDDDE